MKKKIIRHHMDGLIALLLFGVFAVCLLAVLLTGAGAYKRLNNRNEEDYARRTCMQYVANRVHQAPKPSDVRIEPFGSGDALSIIDQDGFITRVYYCDGYLMELYNSPSFTLSPQDGERIMEIGGLDLTMEDGMLTVTVTDSIGRDSEMVLTLSGKGGMSDEK